MADLSSSLFLQALGWATLNSFWQFALLWCCFQLIKHYTSINSNSRYLLAVYSMFIGFGWFAFTFSYFYFNEQALQNSFSVIPINGSASLLPIILSSASIAYLSLLFIPSYKILRNWRFIQKIKKHGLDKAPFRYRIFVQKISAHLGIRKPVKVYLSQLVKSPVTIGFLKPIILIPVAALNNLNVQQVEAVLLHELSHIRRHDYLLNLLLTLVHVFLYFNPFVKLFIRRIEMERENCCDEMVLQFEYDKLSYATALLELEKQSRTPELAMAAANKNHLLSRIEKIVGIQKKKTFNKVNFAGAFATLFLLFIINSMIITSKNKNISPINYFSEPSAFFSSDKVEDVKLEEKVTNPAKQTLVAKTKTPVINAPVAVDEDLIVDYMVTEEPVLAPAFRHVAYTSADEAEASLSLEQKKQVTKTVENTKQVLEHKWKEVERSIGEVMTKEERERAKLEYLAELSKVNWEQLEQNLKTNYEQIDWLKLNNVITEALTTVKIDSLHLNYSMVLKELTKAENQCKVNKLAIPDASTEQIQKAKVEIQLQLDQLNKLRERKIIKL